MSDKIMKISFWRYQRMLRQLSEKFEKTPREINEELVQVMRDSWYHGDLEERARFRENFPGLDRPPTPQEAIPRLAEECRDILKERGAP